MRVWAEIIVLGTVALGLTACSGSERNALACADCPEFVEIPAGEMMLGSEPGPNDPDGSILSRQSYSVPAPFYTSRYEITRSDWWACESDGVCPEARVGRITGFWHHFFEPDDRKPIVMLTMDEIQLYIGWLSARTGLNCRLPTEFEWEYMARAGSTDEFHFGPSATYRDANFDDLSSCYPDLPGERCRADPAADQRNYRSRLRPVGSYAPNAWGLYDLHGNAGELTGSCSSGTFSEARSAGSIDCEYFVDRGGSFASPAGRSRLSSRIAFAKHALDSVTVGFRPICEMHDPE
ncbi:formylglycine-generating enzyme family protein [Maricaulis salignorans]|uniref:Formylglycine-generating enzyme, required for sulfatase activity, contains SUMF1/FGE domain n=1 Tax=Maricaulis salignorans TaxID=144026 RepID=A0A1G9M5N3_9PROT|nr:formylglycine-generating enzyme family protein [Maricaulis salignorans]SDL69612.1 Formylglycine-generating enzyme, required for sulfatase activity, contains SUMF1/FGE domain [Maricaulis salignorans]